jgi:thiol:disulfide interchange protein
MILVRLLLAALLGLSLTPARAAIDPDDLLPVEEAFALKAIAVERGRIEFDWRIAEGYYLYRHRLAVQPVDAAFKFNPLELPDGEKKTDEFFGEVETYRGTLKAVLTGAAASGADAVTFNVRYQGCADVGVCYPPHQQRITVALPVEDAATQAAAPTAKLALPGAAPAAPGLLVSSPPVANATDNPLQQALGGSSEAAGVQGATEALPLPPELAFAFEAIATSPTELLLRFTPAPGYYLYRDRSAFRVIAPDTVHLATPQWPEGSAHEDEHFGQVVVFFQQIEVPLPLRRTRAQAETLQLEATFQGCQTDGICYPPMTRTVQLALPAAAPEQVVSTAAARGGAPGTSPGLALALLFALGGGLILNLMPCVLPVLSLKALSLADSGRSGGHARAGALWYTFGVLLSFVAVGVAVLGLRSAGLALGWGFQLQQPAVIASLVFVIAAIGLNLAGVFEIGARLAGSGQALTQRSGAAGDFFTGVLAVVVATPCTAPFMGTALAYAFAAPAPVALGVFAALGLGLALPFLLIGFVPALARALPRPGAWMQTFKQLLAYPMFITAVWLLWVLGRQRGVDAVALALLGVVVMAAGLWWWGRQGLQRAPLARGFALLLIAGSVSAIWAVHALPPPQASAATDDAQRYSAQALERLRGEGRVVFVNMTADWCVTCKANEKNVLSGDAFRAALAQAEAVYMKGDWTNVDPEITRFLEEHGAVGVPLYVVFAGTGEGEVLPTVLTQRAVESALARARR